MAALAVAISAAMSARAADDLTRPLRACADAHFICQPDGEPFLWLGDTAWAIFARLTREETDHYLRDRADKGFTVIQIVAIGGPFDGLEVPNRYGELALIERNPLRPNPKYFEHIDWVVDRAAHYGLRIAMLPVWGATLVGGLTSKDETFDPATAKAYGRWIGERYRNKGITWVLGGDTNPLWPKGLNFLGAVQKGEQPPPADLTIIDHRPVYDAMAAGIIEGEGATPFFTFHPNPVSYSGTAHPRTSLYFHDRPWFSMNMLQSSHYANEATTIFPWLRSDYTLLGPNNYQAVREEYDSTPTRPVVDGEPRYEGLPVDIQYDEKKGFWDAYDTRNAAYHALFAGAAGHTFGNTSVHLSYDPARYPKSPYPGLKSWREEMQSPGSRQMTFVKALLLSRPFHTRIPDQTLIVGETREGAAHVGATRARDGGHAMIYLPEGKPVTVDLTKLSGQRVVGWWFDPRNGTATRIPGHTATRATHTFTPPSSGARTDWILVLDDESKGYQAPGAAATKQATSEPASPGRCSTQWLATRDGTLLATDVHLPAGDGRFPVIVMRNPYSTAWGGGTGCEATATYSRKFTAGGYVFVTQEVRGTYRSHGQLTPFFQERRDGYDLIEWAARQPWSNGRVGLTGPSYLGVTQWQAALERPPSLLAIAPDITGSDYHDDFIYHNGVFDVQFSMAWAMGSFAPDQLARKLRAAGTAEAEVKARVDEFRKHVSTSLPEWMRQLPLTGNWEPQLRELAPFYFEWLRHPSYDEYWQKIDVQRHIAQVQVPALVSGAWYDLFAEGTLQSFQAMKERAANRGARDGTILTMSWGGHAAFQEPRPEQISWGDDPSDSALLLRFFDRHVKGDRNGIEKDPPVRLVVLVPPDTGFAGSSFLLPADQFPLAGTTPRKWYLGSKGRANTRNGDGVLHETPGSAGADSDQFVYDPLNPVPSVGGNSGTPQHPAGAFDQAEVELRDDVLVYTSAPLPSDLPVIGPVSVRFWARTSARDTDFTAKLVDVHLDEVAHNVVDRIVRARYRDGARAKPRLPSPGQVESYDLELGHTATIFRKGHRIRLEISSSNFPHYARNLNTGETNETTSRTVTAQQEIFHGGKYPSFLQLPIVASVTIAASASSASMGSRSSAL